MEKGELSFVSWQPAKIVKGNGHTYVIRYDNCAEDGSLIANKVPRIARLLGSSKEIYVPFFLMRVSSTWKDDRWNTLHLESDKHKNSNINNLLKGGNWSSQIPSSCPKVLKCGARDGLVTKKYERRTKRSSPLITRASKKMRTTIMGKERDYDGESTSLVASCSFNNGSYRSVGHKVSKRKELHGLINDAESFSNTPKVPLRINHNVEIDSYYSTMMSLYESDFLNWEQELLLTNLRQDLHISNDEHLSTIRHLLSTRRAT